MFDGGLLSSNLTNNYLSRMRELENCLIWFKMFKNTDWTGWTDDGLMSLHPILRHLRNIENCRCTVLYQIYCVFIHLYYLFQTISF